MDITIVEPNAINVKIVNLLLQGNTKKKEKSPKNRLKRQIMDCYAWGLILCVEYLK